MKTNKKHVLIALLLFLVVAILYSRSELPFPLYPYIDTTFAKDFTWDKFDKVTSDMTKDEVKRILGEPIEKVGYGIDNNECWMYSGDGKLQPYADFSWYSARICFTEEKVSSKPVNQFYD